MLDRFIDNDLQRPGALVKDRPLVCGDIHRIPFLDQSFTFVHCAHVLEHVDDPALALSELTRVAYRGYIETPSPLQELLFLNMPFHRWLVWEEDGVLIFSEKPRTWGASDLVINGLKGPFLTIPDAVTEYDELMFIKLFWEQVVPCKVMRTPDPIQSPITARFSESEISKEQQHQHPLKLIAKTLLQRLYHYKVDLFDVLACPGCKGRVLRMTSQVVCERCSLGYPVRDGIPIMLIDEGRPLPRPTSTPATVYRGSRIHG